VTEPDYAPLTVTTYHGHARLYLIPGLGKYSSISSAYGMCVPVRRITVHGTRKTCGTLLAALDVHPVSQSRYSTNLAACPEGTTVTAER
jgi:hypothetical protein